MIVALGLPLNVATIILCCIFLMLFSDFRVSGSISIPTPPTATLTEFFHVDAGANFHPLPVSWCFISLLWRYLCSCMHIMSLLWSIAEAVSSGSWPILFKVLTLNVAICIVLLYFCNFCFILSFVADFSITGARVPVPVGRTPFLPRRRAMRFRRVVWIWVMVIFQWLCFYSHLLQPPK